MKTKVEIKRWRAEGSVEGGRKYRKCKQRVDVEVKGEIRVKGVRG